MSSPPHDTAPRVVQVPVARASSIIVHRVPAEHVERFLEWQRNITAAAAASPGYQATEVYPPVDAGQSQWVVLLHFANADALQRWLTSPARAEWMARLPAELADFHLKTPPGGFGPWFAGLVENGPPPPSWKMAVAVLLGLYPIVMLLTMTLSPYTQRFGLAVSLLIGNAVSVPILEWLGMPVIRLLLGPWLRANEPTNRGRSLVGLVLIAGALVLMALLFSRITS